MKTNILKRFLMLFKSKPEMEPEPEPDPEFVARQLRKPSGDFAQQIGEKMNQVNEALYDLTLGVMQLEEGEKILEIGFGTGKFFGKLISKAKDLQVSGIDFSDKMVEMAKGNNLHAIDSSKLNIKLGRSDAIPFSDASFDKVFCNMVIYFWDQPGKHLKEVHRVLKPSGKFYTGLRTRESMLVFPFVKYGFNLYETEDWIEILGQNGFSYIDTQSRMDTELELKGNKLRLESCCVVAEKKDAS